MALSQLIFGKGTDGQELLGQAAVLLIVIGLIHHGLKADGLREAQISNHHGCIDVIVTGKILSVALQQRSYLSGIFFS